MSPPVVLLAGLATSAARTWRETGWIDLLTDLGRDPRPVELPGHGGRPPLTREEDYGRLDELVAAELPEGPLDGVGFSAGARILLRIEAARPGRFRRLVLGGIGESVLRADDHRRFADAVDAADDPGPGDAAADPVARHFVALARSSGTDVGAVLAMLRRGGTRLGHDELARVEADVLVVIGEKDPAGPGEPLAAAIPRCRLVTLPGVDHFATPKSMGFLDAGLDHLSVAD